MRRSILLAAVLGATLAVLPATSRATVEFVAPGATDGLARALRGASLSLAGKAEGRTDAQDVYAAARQDYARLLGALYAAGHYSGVISIRLDGREAADIPPLSAPARIDKVEITVEPGPIFTFGTARIGPLAPGTAVPEGFRTGAGAYSGLIRDAADAAVTGWREAGHAKAAIGRQGLTADHRAARLDADIGVNPGPQVRFGRLSFSGQERMHLGRLHAIAGFPEGRVYSPRDMRRVADRLRRTGVFRSATLTEAERLGPGDTLDVAVALVEDAPRRIGFGAEIASLDGITVTGFWLHRNLFGGAERLRFDAEVAQIGSQTSGIDYRLGATLERPATFHPDITMAVALGLSHVEDRDQTTDEAQIGVTFTQFFSETITGRAGLQFTAQEVTDAIGTRGFQTLALPVGFTWDRRDNAFDATRGTYLDAEIAPYLGFGATNSGARVRFDGRLFQPLGERIVLAGRVQGGAVVADGIAATPRSFLFYSGGGGTVRGQPFQALGVNVLPGQRTGGMRFLAASAEVRAKVTRSIGAVAFYDVGLIGATEFGDAAGGMHAGAGIGLRYATPIGPVRLDVAAPVGGNTGKGVQFYIGIGQAF
ncbi:MAG: autotransporter assembly complex protein TamA [Gemmobacter sp.]